MCNQLVVYRWSFQCLLLANIGMGIRTHVFVHVLAQFISGVFNCEVARGGGKGSREHTTLITERGSASIYRGERVGVYENFFVH
jgi:hypothetical protein